jgi:hypothetical protein
MNKIIFVNKIMTLTNIKADDTLSINTTNLHVASVQDTTKSKSNSSGASFFSFPSSPMGMHI